MNFLKNFIIFLQIVLLINVSCYQDSTKDKERQKGEVESKIELEANNPMLKELRMTQDVIALNEKGIEIEWEKAQHYAYYGVPYKCILIPIKGNTLKFIGFYYKKDIKKNKALMVELIREGTNRDDQVSVINFYSGTGEYIFNIKINKNGIINEPNPICYKACIFLNPITYLGYSEILIFNLICYDETSSFCQNFGQIVLGTFLLSLMMCTALCPSL